MANVPTVVVGTGNQRKVVTPALLTGLDSTGALVPLKVDSSGQLLTSTSGGGGSAGQIFTNDGGTNVWAYGVNNTTGEVMGWTSTTGLFVNSQSNDNSIAVFFDERILFGIDGDQRTLDWSNGLTSVDSNGYTIISAGPSDRKLYDINGDLAIDFNNNNLSTEDITSIGLENTVSIDWKNRNLKGVITGTDSESNPFTANTKLLSWSGSDGLVLYSGNTVNTSGSISVSVNLPYPKTQQLVGGVASGQPGVISSMNSQLFALTAANSYTATLAVTSANDITMVINSTTNSSAASTINIVNWQLSGSGDPSGIGVITIFSRVAINSLTFTWNSGNNTFYGSVPTSMTANQAIVLRKRSTAIYRIQ